MAQAQDTVSSTRLYLGNLPRNITKQEVEEHFSAHGAGTIKEIKLMNGFGFIEYEDHMDARDVVPGESSSIAASLEYHQLTHSSFPYAKTLHIDYDVQFSLLLDGSDLKGERLTVQFARGPRRKDDFNPQERQAPRPRRTIYRMTITGLQPDTSWQDLKDFARSTGQLDVVYSETGRNDGKGFVEFETGTDLKTAVEKLDGREFKGATVQCVADIQDERDLRQYRQRSPLGRGRYGPPPDEYYDRRGPPPARGYSPPRYRERSPGRRPPPYDEYYDRGYARRSPPRDYLPAPRRYDDPYDGRAAPPPPARGYDPYARGDPYARPRSPPPGRGYGSYGGGGPEYRGYDERRPY